MVLLDVFHGLKKTPLCFIMKIFALGRWLLTGHGISLRVQYDRKQMAYSIRALWLLVWSYWSCNVL